MRRFTVLTLVLCSLLAAAGCSPGGSTEGGSGGTGGAAGTVTIPIPADPCAPRAGYHNLFAELLGKTDAEITAKLAAGYTSLFHGGSNEAVYHESGSDGAYILDVNDNDVRTEGQSYGMMISVQLDKKDEFNRIWRWTKQHMSRGNGLFSWKASSAGAANGGTAPDGEEYFATALIFASHKWGDGAAPLDYGAEAKATLNGLATTSNFNTAAKLVTFGESTNYTDPSYMLPAFYQVWACFDSAHQALWKDAVTASRGFFQKTTHQTTGLAPYLANFDGTPSNALGGGATFQSDAWRVVGNIMMDHHFFNADPWQTTWAMKYATFFQAANAMKPIPDELTLSGTPTHTNSGFSIGLLAQNALVAFGVPADVGTPFVQSLWNQAPPTGQYRYYDGMLYMLALLHASGRFQLW